MNNLCNMCNTNTGSKWGYVQVVYSSNTIEKTQKFLCDFCHTEYAIKNKKWRR